MLLAFAVVTGLKADPTERQDREGNQPKLAISRDQQDSHGRGHEKGREDHPGKPKPPKPPGHRPNPLAPPELLTAEAVSGFQVNLSWTDQSTNELGFKLERSLDGTNYVQMAQVLPDTVTYRDSGRFPDTKYFYRVRAFNAKGDSAYSAVARTQTPAPTCQLSVANWEYSTPVPPGLTNVVGLAAGANHATVLKQDGSVISWRAGQGSATPVATENLSNVVAVAAGFHHSLALRANGTITGWGDNSAGQTDVPKKLVNVVAIAAGRAHSLALQNDGTVAGWGDNSCGQSFPPRHLAGVVAIAAGAQFSLALRSDGTVVTWGARVTSQSPAPEDLTNVVLIAAGDYTGLALHGDGRISSWSYSGHIASSPPENLTGIVALSSGRSRNFALRDDGTLASWGQDDYLSPPPPTNLTGVVAISSRQFQNLVLTDAPVPPTGLSAQVQANHRVSLSWTNPSVPVENLRIERTTNVCFPVPGAPEVPADWTTLATVPGETTSYDDNDTVTNLLYAYRLQAFNACGASTYSRTAKARPTAPVLKSQTFSETSVMTSLRTLSATAPPEIQIMARTSSNTIQLQFTAQANQRYVIQYRESLTADEWRPLVVIDPLPFPHPITFEDRVPAGTAARFYRLEAQ